MHKKEKNDEKTVSPYACCSNDAALPHNRL